jgi:hypothetical protein
MAEGSKGGLYLTKSKLLVLVREVNGGNYVFYEWKRCIFRGRVNRPRGFRPEINSFTKADHFLAKSYFKSSQYSQTE